MEQNKQKGAKAIDFVIILDAAHGKETPGKRSPDQTHFEYKWSRARVDGIYKKLIKKQITCYKTVENENEPGLTARVKKANSFPGNNKILLSLHNNAASNKPVWTRATGNEIYTSPGKTKADKYASIIINRIKESFPSLKFRSGYSETDPDEDKEARFTVIAGNAKYKIKPNYNGILIEWLFQDNKEDLKLLKCSKTNERFENIIADSIIEIKESL